MSAALMALLASPLVLAQGLPDENPFEPAGLTLSSGLIKDTESGRVLWSKDPDAIRFPASTTKMITALVLLERTKPTDVVTIPKEAAATRGSGIGVKTGQKWTMESLIKAILMRSANDACVAGAIHCAGSVPAFVILMNQKAAQLGASSTKFVNPHGLHDPAHVSSASDLAKIAEAAMKNPEFRKITGTRFAMIGPIGAPPKKEESTNHLLRDDPTSKGVKTGWTNPAGRCFVGWHEGNDMTLVTVVLGAKKWQDDQKAMMSWFWSSFEKAELVKKGQEVSQVEIPGAFGGPTPLFATEGLTAIMRKDRPPMRIRLAEGLKAPLAPGQPLGFADFGEGFSVPLTTDDYVPSRLQVFGGGGLLAAMGAGAFLARRQRRKA